MLLTNLYQKFITHTNLTDSLYKSIFMQLSDILEKVNGLKFIQLSYRVGDSNGTHVFDGKSPIPHYFVEMIKNLFERFYTLPSNSEIKLDISYNGTVYSVVSTGEDVFIPEQLQFIVTFKLYEFFIINNRAEDFDTEFNKIEYLFLNMSKNGKPQVKELFDIFEKEEEYHPQPNGENIDEIQANIEQLKSSRMQAVSKLDDLTLTIEQLNTKKLDIEKHYNEYTSLSDNYLKTQSELDTLKTEYDGYTKKITDVSTTVEDIRKELIGNEHESSPDLDFLRDKKYKLEQAKQVMMNNRDQVASFSSALGVKLQDYKLDMEKVKDYNATALSKIVAELQYLLQQKEQWQSMILAYENDIHIGTSALIAKLNPKAAVVDSSTLISKLSNGHLSKSLNLVLNYIRDYYRYTAMKYDSTFSKENIESDVCQILAAKKAFYEVFNLNIPYVFSFINEKYSKHLNIIFIKAIRSN